VLSSEDQVCYYAYWSEKDGAMTFSFTILSKIFHFNHLRTLVLTNVPVKIRSEKELKEYFKYCLSRPFATPLVGLSSSAQPGLPLAFVFNLGNFKYLLISPRQPAADGIRKD